MLGGDESTVKVTAVSVSFTVKCPVELAGAVGSCRAAALSGKRGFFGRLPAKSLAALSGCALCLF